MGRFYYKVGQVLQSGTILLQSGTAFRYYKVGRFYYKVGRFYDKVGRVLQSGTGITKWDNFITKWDNFITKWDDYYKVGFNTSYYMASFTSGEMPHSDWPRSTFSGPLPKQANCKIKVQNQVPKGI